MQGGAILDPKVHPRSGRYSSYGQRSVIHSYTIRMCVVTLVWMTPLSDVKFDRRAELFKHSQKASELQLLLITELRNLLEFPKIPTSRLSKSTKWWSSKCYDEKGIELW